MNINENLNKHWNEILYFKETGNPIWIKKDKWKLTSNPKWDLNDIYVIDDKVSNYRKALKDGLNVTVLNENIKITEQNIADYIGKLYIKDKYPKYFLNVNTKKVIKFKTKNKAVILPINNDNTKPINSNISLTTIENDNNWNKLTDFIEPKFNIGDFLSLKIGSNIHDDNKTLPVKKIFFVENTFIYRFFGDINIDFIDYYEDDLIEWIPSKNEYIWVYNKNKVIIFGTFDSFEIDGTYTINESEFCYEFAEPFFGKIPIILENKNV